MTFYRNKLPHGILFSFANALFFDRHSVSPDLIGHTRFSIGWLYLLSFIKSTNRLNWKQQRKLIK